MPTLNSEIKNVSRNGHPELHGRDWLNAWF